MQSLLDRLATELKASIAGQRDIKTCRLLAARINAAAKYTRDPAQRRQWAQQLAKIIAGHETFKPKTTRKKTKVLRDPCADAIKGLRSAT